MGSTGHRWTQKRWSADTEIAFLLALKLTGTISAACAEIGRSHAGVNRRRRTDPAFAAKCEMILAEQQWRTRAAEQARIASIGGSNDPYLTGAMRNQVHYDGWTPLRQRAFLRALASTGRIEQACAMVAMSASSARRMRKKYPDFDAACEAALAKAIPTLQQIAIDRAINGVTEAVWHGGKLVGQRQRYSDGLMREMLKREDTQADQHKSKAELIRDAEAAATRAGGSFSTLQRVSHEELVEAIEKRIEAVERHRERQAEARQQRLAGSEG